MSEMISPQTANAISSTVTAPIGAPIGHLTKPKRSSETPSPFADFVNSLHLVFDPMHPILHGISSEYDSSPINSF